ncbi:hypothetical protein [Actinoalloteichus sp. AHMU CJ021]|uniref:hypothetical protein n=1 Tax=Actinoalloteichus sp. AHMU CJ021 TaxID=2072503 RepID=UPI00307B486A
MNENALYSVGDVGRHQSSPVASRVSQAGTPSPRSSGTTVDSSSYKAFERIWRDWRGHAPATWRANLDAAVVPEFSDCNTRKRYSFTNSLLCDDNRWAGSRRAVSVLAA